MDGSCLREKLDLPGFPTSTKVLIKPDEFEEKTKGGIFIPETVRDKHQWAVEKGVVLGFGGEAFQEYNEPRPKAGDRIFFSRHAGAEFWREEAGKRVRYRIIQDDDILLILNEPTVEHQS